MSEMNRIWKISAAIGILLAVPMQALARDSWLEGTATLGFGHDNASADADTGTSRLRNQAWASGGLTWGKVLANGDELRLGGALGMEGYQDASDLNRFSYAFDAEYRTDLNPDLQLRVFGSFDGKYGDTGEVFNRIRGGAQLRYRSSREHLSWARVRLGYRNQNEAKTFDGYDQGERLVELGHDWRPWGDRRAFIVTGYGDFRDADAERYSYQEYGLRLIARQPVNDDLDLSLRVSAFERQYDGLFSGSYPEERDDTRLRAVMQADYKLQDNVTLTAYAGWERNASNVPVRDYEGAVAGISITFDKLFWEK